MKACKDCKHFCGVAGSSFSGTACAKHTVLKKTYTNGAQQVPISNIEARMDDNLCGGDAKDFFTQDIL